MARRQIVVERNGGLVSGIHFGCGCVLFGLALIGALAVVVFFVVGGAR